jgi:hypothetical protein
MDFELEPAHLVPGFHPQRYVFVRLLRASVRDLSPSKNMVWGKWTQPEGALGI